MHALHSESTFQELLSLDVIGLYAHLTVTVMDDNMSRKMLALRGPGAQTLLDLLQTVCTCGRPPYGPSAYFNQRLDFVMNPMYKRRHFKAFMKLSRASGLYPECLVLKGVDMERHPVTRGGYGDVHVGLLHGQRIAVKVLRIYQNSDLVKLHKVVPDQSVQ